MSRTVTDSFELGRRSCVLIYESGNLPVVGTGIISKSRVIGCTDLRCFGRRFLTHTVTDFYAGETVPGRRGLLRGMDTLRITYLRKIAYPQKASGIRLCACGLPFGIHQIQAYSSTLV